MNVHQVCRKRGLAISSEVQIEQSVSVRVSVCLGVQKIKGPLSELKDL